MEADSFEHLSRREQEVLWALMHGVSAREIAKQSYVALPTVRSQIRAVLSKLGVSSQLAAVALAYQCNWSPSRGGDAGNAATGQAGTVSVGIA
jgi:DNA-binding NarL/FixJ family response regulator